MKTGRWIMPRHIIIFLITTVVISAIVEAAQQTDLWEGPPLQLL
jgi:hypothetical protein